MLVVGGSSGDSCAAPSLAFTWEMENGVLWLLLLWMELGALLTLLAGSSGPKKHVPLDEGRIAGSILPCPGYLRVIRVCGI